MFLSIPPRTLEIRINPQLLGVILKPPNFCTLSLWEVRVTDVSSMPLFGEAGLLADGSDPREDVRPEAGLSSGSTYVAPFPRGFEKGSPQRSDRPCAADTLHGTRDLTRRLVLAVR